MSITITFPVGYKPVLKHGDHDQTDHGAWATEGSAKEKEIHERITDVKTSDYERDKYDEEDKNLYQKIEAKYKTKDGKTYLLSQENIKTPDGNNIIEVRAYEPKTLASGKQGGKQIGSLGTEGRTSSIIDGVYVDEEYQRQGIATAMLNMARTYAPDNMKISHSFSLTDDAKGWSSVVKHGDHDQSSHGSWATGITTELSEWSPKEKVPDSPRNATGTTQKFWDNWEHGVDGDQFVDLYRQYAGEMLGLPVPKSDKDVGGTENYLTQRGFGASSTDAVRNQTEAVLNAIANGRPQPALYRGMAAGNEESKALLEQFTRLKEGDTIDMPLVSTTRSLGVAQWYAADRSYTPSDAKVILKIQEGAKGVSVNREKSFYPSDFETITSGKFEVVGKSEVTVPYWARGAVHARTFELSRPGEDLVTGYRFQDPKDLSWDRKDSNDPAAKVRYETIRDGANTGDFSKIETPTLKYTNDRQPNGVKNGRDITVNSWTRKEPTTFTVIEVKMVEPHVVKKGADLGMTFHNLFNDIPFIRDEEDVKKHGEHDQSSHGAWATGEPVADIEEWAKSESSKFSSETEQEIYLLERTMSQAKGLIDGKYKGAVNAYQTATGYTINEALRDPQISEGQVQPYIDGLDNAIKDATPTSEDMTVYRGIKGNGLDFFESLKSGDVFQDKGFVSTTLDPNTVTKFSVQGSMYQGIVMRMQIPAGSKGLFPMSVTGMGQASSREAEFILPRDSKFKILSNEGKVWDVGVVND
jgi:GNAT superfamily N-acetyltransferase